MSIPCSVYIVTLNCAAWLEDTLNSVADFAEVIILDSGSTDSTKEIAEKSLKATQHMLKVSK